METSNTNSWLDQPVIKNMPVVRLQTLIIVLILILTVFTRFYILGERVMSHDEVNHVVPSFSLYEGRGYAHDPVTHGPMQFHLLALSYFLFGDSDFTSRIPSALFSIATVACVLFLFPRYLGRVGALLAGLFYSISPYMLFYGRYTRNEAFVALFGVLTIYAVLRYLEKGERKMLYLLTTVTALHYATKETSFIYSAILLIFLALVFLRDLVRYRWPDPRKLSTFITLMATAIALVGLAIGIAAYNAAAAKNAAEATAGLAFLKWVDIAAVAGAFITAVLGVSLLVKSLGWRAIRALHSFDLLIISGSLILPQLTAFPVKMIGTLTGAGWSPLDYGDVGMLRTGLVLVAMFALSALIGLWWNWKTWLGNAAVFYAIFVVLYTTFFTNGNGFFTGIVGGLGYWLSQQGEFRGSQPWYYYAFLQVPIYEYLAALGTLLAVYFAAKWRKFSHVAGASPAYAPANIRGELIELDNLPPQDPEANLFVLLSGQPARGEPMAEDAPAEPADLDEALSAETADRETAPAMQPHLVLNDRPLPVMAMLLFWSVMSLLAYSLAGEKMPWLTVHITLPMLLAAGWGLGWLVDTTPWRELFNRKGVITLILLPIFLAGLGLVLGSLGGANPPFQGRELDQLNATSSFFFALVMTLASGAGLFYLLKSWRSQNVLRLLTITFFGALMVLTARVAYTASFINYDNAKEFLVYAHAASGPKQILAQIEEISQRTTRGRGLVVAYDNDANYPFWWYLRHYDNKRWFTDVSRDLADAAVIVVGDANYDKIEPVVRDQFISYEYFRLWWPMQDYTNMTFERLSGWLADPKMRSALWQIWLNRDYREYAAVTGSETLTLENWQPSTREKMYIRKDIIAQMWNYGAAVTAAEPVADDYLDKTISLTSNLVVGLPGGLVTFTAPRGMALAPDGTFYVADSRANRIVHLDASGNQLQAWGTFADVALGAAPGGTFNEPWGVGVGPDGSVYVADTWNHRIQKFTADGQFLTMWGYFGQAETPDAFWGPRDIAVDADGLVYVTDTGNKRVAVFDSNGAYVNEFGGAGLEPGFFDEPVGLDIGTDGKIYVADTWNRRVQVFEKDEANFAYRVVASWDVSAWYGSSLENKPFIAVDASGNVFITDPESFRVVEFNNAGEVLRVWGELGTAPAGFNLASGIMVDREGMIWVSDGINNNLQRFELP